MIRNATHDDKPRLMALAQIMHAESRFAEKYPFDTDKVADLLTAAIDSEVHCALVCTDGTDVNGALFGYVAEQYFSRAKVAQDMALFVSPDKRGGIAAVRLCKAFHAWSKTVGAVDCEIAHNTDVQPERFGLLMEASGFHLVGRLFSKGV